MMLKYTKAIYVKASIKIDEVDNQNELESNAQKTFFKK